MEVSLTTKMIMALLMMVFYFGEETFGGNIEEEETNRFNGFDWGLTKIVENNFSDNVVISPISVKLALATLFEGAKGNSSKQLEKALNLQQSGRVYTTAKFASILRSLQIPGEGYNLDIGTKVFTDKRTTPKSAFKGKIEFLYDASVDTVDFRKPTEAAMKINNWAKTATQGHITDLVSENDVTERTVMLLINAIYFKGRWEYPFPAKDTAPGVFHTSSKTTVTAPFMSAVNTLKYYRSPELKASVVRLPYAGDKFAMYVLLPDKIEGLQEVMQAIDPYRLKALLPKMEDISVKILLPKFSFEFTASLAPALEAMGVKDIFSGRANLTGIADSPDENLYVSNILQKAGLVVNEIGSEAYAATQVELASKFGEEVAEFKANHPFLFFIEEELTRTVVFVGKVVNPTSIIDHHSTPHKKPQYQNTVAAAEIVQAITEAKDTNSTEAEETVDRLGGGFGNNVGDRFQYFDIDLIQRIHKETRQNFVVSPASIKSILGLIVEGAEGKSASELLSLLRLPNNKVQAKERLYTFQKQVENPHPKVTIKSGNRILVGKELKLKPSYEESVVSKFSAQVNAIDFKSPQTTAKFINEWVNKLTEGFIPKLVNPESLDPNALVILVNAMYFKGEWKIKFDPKDTQHECFFISSNDCVKTNMMITSEKFKYGYVSGLNARIVELPYNDERYSMVLILPEEKGGLNQVVRDLSFTSLLTLLDQLSTEDVTVQIPKFTIEYDIQLIPILEKAGIKSIFSDKADLSSMLVGKSGGKISNIIHKAKIEVNEKGTTAGAGTSAVVVPLMVPKGEEFIANRPFLFFIRDSVSGLLFGGQFVHPSDSFKNQDQMGTASEKPQNINQQGVEGVTTVGNYGAPSRRPQVQSRPYPPRPSPQTASIRDNIRFPI